MDFLMGLTSVRPWVFQVQHRRRRTVAIAHRVQSWAYLQVCAFALCPYFCYKLQEEWTTDSCGKCSQHQGNRDQIFKVMWLQNMPTWEGNYYFREYICSNSKAFCSTSYVPHVLPFLTFSCSLMSLGELAEFARVNTILHFSLEAKTGI